jgi:acyl-[acyl carrier protein]--UDP-N-acetylglucosamine O-acyltransferase
VDCALLVDLLDTDVPAWLLTKNVRHQIDHAAFERLMRDMFDENQHHALHDAICNRFAFRGEP